MLDDQVLLKGATSVWLDPRQKFLAALERTAHTHTDAGSDVAKLNDVWFAVSSQLLTDRP